MAQVKLLDPADSKRRLDRYELIGELASGGMATVYLARLAGVGGFQRFVAIKRLHPHLAAEEEFIEMFLDEARLAAGIHHPHVVPILEIGQTESGYYLVMEYIEGDTLARIVARAISGGQSVPRSILLRIVIDALAGLHAAHELTDAHGESVQLIHRDCSPQNILVGVDGSSRITDFGVARASSRIASTRGDRVKGKLAYMSPEQARGESDLDRRSDLFAMGIILWEVLAGRRLFKADTDVQTLRRVTDAPIPRLSALVTDLHPALVDACARALDRDPDRRYQTAAEMADGLERAARAAAAASPGAVTLASPREVAGYVQGALGQDIAAQRESVRAWIAHSEPSLPAVTQRQIKAGHNGPGSQAQSVPPTAPPSRSLTPAPMPRTLLGVGPEVVVLDDELAVADDTDQHETHLMMRDAVKAQLALPRSPEAPKVPRSSPDFHDPTPLASSGALLARGSSRRPRVVALVIGLAVLLGGAVIWSRVHTSEPMSAGAPPPGPDLVPGTATAHDAVPSAASTAPPEVATTAAAATPPATATTARAPSSGGHRSAPAKPGSPAAPKPPPGAGEDLANPYR